MRNKATKKNMDLDLRRYGNKLYSKAEKSGGKDDGQGEGDSEEIDKINVPIFPIFIGKLVGFVDNTEPTWDGNSLTTDDDLIPIDGVFDYCENDKNLHTGQWYFAPVFEYDESLDTNEGYNGYRGFGSFSVSVDGNSYSCEAYNANTCMPIYVKGVKYLIAWEIGD